MINVLNNFYLEQINELPTRNDRILDLMITSHPTLVTRTTTCPPIGKSDHDILSVSTNITPRISKQRSRSVPNYKKANWEGIKQDLISSRDKFIAKFESGTNMDTIEENWKQFKEAIETCIEKHIPKKKIGKHHDVPWMTTDIKRLIRKKQRLYNKSKKSKKPSHKKAFKDIRSLIRNKLHKNYWDYLNNMLDPEKDNNSKKFWKYIKSRKQDTMGIGTLKNNGVLAETAEQKAEMLNSQFTSVFTTENTTNMPSKGNSPFKPMKDIKISEKGVEKELNRLNPCKATGPDKVPVRILKETANIITPILTKIYQQSIDTGQIPEDWKHANIVPIFKKGDRSKPSNYRPVSLTSVASKILEHIIVSQIMEHLDNQNILNENQHGFRAKRSCESQLLMTTNDITKWMNNNIQVDIAILDFAKAFDKVAHKRLSEKLQYYGIDGTTRIWIDAFLSKRIQRVVVDGEASMCSHVTSGVPQGTVLGPTLFLVFINDIADNLHSTARVFADDCNI